MDLGHFCSDFESCGWSLCMLDVELHALEVLGSVVVAYSANWFGGECK